MVRGTLIAEGRRLMYYERNLDWSSRYVIGAGISSWARTSGSIGFQVCTAVSGSYIYGGLCAEGTLLVDWVAVRPIVSPEPFITDWEAPTAPPTSISPQGLYAEPIY